MTTDDHREQTCAQRVHTNLEMRAEQLAELFARAEADDQEMAEAGYDELAELPLGITVYEVLRIDLSTGGPGDWLEVKLGRGARRQAEVEAVAYHFADWFDHAEETVAEDSSLWRYAEHIAEMMP